MPPAAAFKAEAGGALVLPGALHGFDVFASEASCTPPPAPLSPPNGSAKTSPGTLLTPGEKPGIWQVAFSYAGAPGEGSVRLGYMTRFRDRLYVALSPLYGLDQHDFLVLEPPKDSSVLSNAHARAIQVTTRGGAHTLRWYNRYAQA